MTNALPKDFCPYKGLQPYTEVDRAFFFGRERDSEIIASNLYASPLTVLYGESGVGKSSVLLAGVIPLLRQTSNVTVMVFRQWQDAKFASVLKTELLAAIKVATGKEAKVDLNLPLDEFLIACNRVSRGPIFFLFDQFEEFFLYHAPSTSTEGFDAEWARAVNRQDVDANFLISLREDSLSRLDRFRGRIPKLLTNMLRLKHLDCKAGRDAIRKPLDKYNELLSDGLQRMSIEEPLVETLLEEIQAGRVTLGAARGKVSDQNAGNESREERIETPFLQMVLTRLWDEERAAASDLLRLETLSKLGGAERIIRTHLDKVLEKFSDQEREVAGRLFRYLVTPSGSKIAHTISDLVSYVEMPREEVEPVLDMLSAPDVRILRPIAPPPDEPEQFRYEIFHDVLAASVLDWRRRYTEQQAQEQIRRDEQKRLQRAQEEEERARQLKATRRMRIGLTVVSLLLLVTIVSLVAVYRQWRQLTEADKNTLSREKAADARAELDEDPMQALLLAREAVEINPTEQARSTLRDVLSKFYLRQVLSGHEGAVRDVAYSPDGKFIATAGWDNTVRVWNAQTGETIKVLGDRNRGHLLGIDYSHDGKFIVAGGSDKMVHIWDTASWQATVLKDNSLRAGIYHVDISSDSRYVAAAADTQVVIFDRLEYKEGYTPVIIKMTRPARAYCVQFSPDGRYIVIAGGDPVAYIWNLSAEGGPKLETTLEGPSGVFRRAAFSPDGNFIVTASEGSYKDSKSIGAVADKGQGTSGHEVKEAKTDEEDWAARVWLWRNRSYTQSFANHKGPVYDAMFSPDGRYVVSVSRDNTAQVWDVKDSSTLAELLGHQKALYSAAFSPDGRFVTTASEDGTARIWQVINDPIPQNTSARRLKEMADQLIQRLKLKPEEQRK